MMWLDGTLWRQNLGGSKFHRISLLALAGFPRAICFLVHTSFTQYSLLEDSYQKPVAGIKRYELYLYTAAGHKKYLILQNGDDDNGLPLPPAATEPTTRIPRRPVLLSNRSKAVVVGELHLVLNAISEKVQSLPQPVMEGCVNPLRRVLEKWQANATIALVELSPTREQRLEDALAQPQENLRETIEDVILADVFTSRVNHPQVTFSNQYICYSNCLATILNV